MAEEVVKETDKKEEKKPKSKLRKTLEWVFTGIFGVLIVALGVINVARWTNKDGYIFNYLFPQVLSESMEPDYMTNEVIVVKKVDVDTLKVGDDITFYYKFPDFKDKVMCTHRIIEIIPSTDSSTDYRYTFVCQGINRESERWSEAKQYPHENDVLGKVVGKSAFVGFLYQAFSSVWTLLILILLPSLYLVISAIIDLFKKIPDEDDEPTLAGANGANIEVKKSDRLKEMSDEERERLKKQLLDEMLKKKKEGK